MKNFCTQEDLCFVEIEKDISKASEIASVINEAYKKAKFLKKNRITLEEVEESIESNNKSIYLYYFKNVICGVILIDYFEENKAELGLFAIHPDFQGKGFGAKFMAKVENVVFKKAKEIFMTVIPITQENLINFYKKLGYKLTKEKKEFPEKNKNLISPEYRDQVYFHIMKKNS
jgi:dTDP-4-amino-4,6-dideoxy-D-galactose acyltransferase